jgi:hypothetical protein
MSSVAAGELQEWTSWCNGGSSCAGFDQVRLTSAVLQPHDLSVLKVAGWLAAGFGL